MTRDRLVAATERIVEVWGTDETTGLASFSPGADASMKRWWIARDRAGATPGAIRELIFNNIDIDLRPALPLIQAPTLVLHPETLGAEGAYIAERIPGARLVITPDAEYLPWLVPEVVDEVEEFLTGVRPTPLTDRVLGTIVVTDIVGSTERVRELGDRAWGELLEHHHLLTR
jgi:pimeloyl-ACP methyl ester carboxylesterase